MAHVGLNPEASSFAATFSPHSIQQASRPPSRKTSISADPTSDGLHPPPTGADLMGLTPAPLAEGRRVRVDNVFYGVKFVPELLESLQIPSSNIQRVHSMGGAVGPGMCWVDFTTHEAATEAVLKLRAEFRKWTPEVSLCVPPGTTRSGRSTASDCRSADSCVLAAAAATAATAAIDDVARRRPSMSSSSAHSPRSTSNFMSPAAGDDTFSVAGSIPDNLSTLTGDHDLDEVEEQTHHLTMIAADRAESPYQEDNMTHEPKTPSKTRRAWTHAASYPTLPKRAGRRLGNKTAKVPSVVGVAPVPVSIPSWAEVTRKMSSVTVEEVTPDTEATAAPAAARGPAARARVSTRDTAAASKPPPHRTLFVTGLGPTNDQDAHRQEMLSMFSKYNVAAISNRRKTDPSSRYASCFVDMATAEDASRALADWAKQSSHHHFNAGPQVVVKCARAESNRPLDYTLSRPAGERNSRKNRI